MCKFFGVSRSGYYDFAQRLGRSEKDTDFAEIIRRQREMEDKAPAVFKSNPNKPNVIYRVAVVPESLEGEKRAAEETVLKTTRNLEQIRETTSLRDGLRVRLHWLRRGPSHVHEDPQ